MKKTLGEIHLKLLYKPPVEKDDGALHVEVIEAKDLPSKDSNGFSDPFVVLDVAKQEKKTSTIKKTLSPTYNEKFDFKIRAGDKPSLQVTVYDWNRIGSNVFMAQTRIGLQSLEANVAVDKWFSLLDEGESEPSEEQAEEGDEGEEDASESKSHRTKSKKEINFHNIFGIEEECIHKYSCAIEKMIPHQGTIYLTKSYVCFYSSGLGLKKTKEVIPVADIVEIHKKNTAMVVPNAIEIVTKDGKFVFTSFMKRDEAHTELTKLIHPTGKAENVEEKPEVKETTVKEATVKEATVKEAEPAPEAVEKVVTGDKLETAPHVETPSKPSKFQKRFNLPGEKEIKSYNCAIMDIIMRQGTMYVTNNYVCFYSKVAASKNKTVIPVKEITSVTRKKTAMVVPNAIEIRTANQRYVFSSFISRDEAFAEISRLLDPQVVEPPQQDRAVSGELRLKITYSPPQVEKVGSVTIEVIDGKDFASKDSNGLSDPYVVLKLGKKEQSTQVIKETLNPVFNESFEFPVKASSNKQLTVTVWDWDAIGNAEFMGRLELDLDEFPPDTPSENTYQLLHKDKAHEQYTQNLALKEERRRKEEAERIENERLEVERVQKETMEQMMLEKKQKEEEEAFLQAHPEERERRRLQAMFSSYSNVLMYAHAILTWKRPAEFGGLVALITLQFLFFWWMDVTAISVFFLFACGLVFLWWLSDLITLKLPWEKVLGTNPDPNEVYDFIIQFHAHLTRFLAGQKQQAQLKTAGILLVVSLIGYFFNETLLFFLFLWGLLCVPGVFNMRLKKMKEQEKKNT